MFDSNEYFSIAFQVINILAVVVKEISRRAPRDVNHFTDLGKQGFEFI